MLRRDVMYSPCASPASDLYEEGTGARLKHAISPPRQPALSPSLVASLNTSSPRPMQPSPSAPQASSSLSERLRGQQKGQRGGSPRGSNVSQMVRREDHPLNKGKRGRNCTGLPGKLYNRHDLLEPIIDSMRLMYYKLGWSVSYPSQHSSSNEVSFAYSPQRGGSSSGRPPSLCKGCFNPDPNEFFPTADKSHLACKLCGVVSSAIHIATDREKNCAREDDKTAHADKPFERRTDKYDEPAKSCDELRKEREQQVMSSRVSKKAKEKHGLGWAHEQSVRQAAKAERERHEMDPKDATKGNHIQQEMDKLFTPLEPLNSQIKRFCRMEADRAWREAVRHCNVCCSKASCQLRIKDRGPAVIAEAVFACSLSNLLDGTPALDGVTHSGLLVLADKRVGLQQSKGGSSAHRAVQTVVATLLSNDQSTAIPQCQPIQIKPEHEEAVSPKLVATTPFSRSDSNASDVAEEAGELIQLRNHLNRVQKAICPSVPRTVLDGALKAVQVHDFRTTLLKKGVEDLKPLTQSGLAFVLLDAVSFKLSGAGFLASTPPRLLQEFAAPGANLQRAVAAARELLPAHAVEPDDSADYLF